MLNQPPKPKAKVTNLKRQRTNTLTKGKMRERVREGGREEKKEGLRKWIKENGPSQIKYNKAIHLSLGSGGIMEWEVSNFGLDEETKYN